MKIRADLENMHNEFVEEDKKSKTRRERQAVGSVDSVQYQVQSRKSWENSKSPDTYSLYKRNDELENMGPTTADNIDFGQDFDQSIKQLQDYWDK